VTQAGRCPLINERRVGIISRSSSTYYQTRQFGPPLTRCYNRFTLNGPSIKYTKLHSGFDSSRACASGLAPPNANPFAAAVLLRGINSVICNRALVFVAANARIRSRVSAESTALRCEIDFPPRTWMSSNAARRSWRGKVTARVPLSLSLSLAIVDLILVLILALRRISARWIFVKDSRGEKNRARGMKACALIPHAPRPREDSSD